MSKSLLIAATVIVFACSATSSSYAKPMAAILVDAYNKKKVQVDLGTQGGQNDPTQLFQQILNDLTQGQQRAPGGEGPNPAPLRPELKSMAVRGLLSRLWVGLESVRSSTA